MVARLTRACGRGNRKWFLLATPIAPIPRMHVSFVPQVNVATPNAEPLLPIIRARTVFALLAFLCGETKHPRAAPSSPSNATRWPRKGTRNAKTVSERIIFGLTAKERRERKKVIPQSAPNHFAIPRCSIAVAGSSLTSCAHNHSAKFAPAP